MSVLPMKHVFIAALKKDRKEILESLQRLGMVEVSVTAKDPASKKEFKKDKVFKRTDMSAAKATFEKNASLAAQALAVLDKEVPVKSGLLDSFAGREKMSIKDYEAHVALREEIMDMVYRLNKLSKQKAEAEAEIPKLLNQKETLTPWLSFELPLDFKGTKSTRAFIGSFPETYDQASLQAAFAEKAPDVSLVDISIISAAEGQTCVFVICHETKAKETEEALRSLGFARPALPSMIPSEQAKEIDAKLEKTNEQLASISRKIADYSPKRDEIAFIIDYFTMRADKYEVISGLSQSKRVFCLTGYIAEKDVKYLDTEIGAKFDCVIEYTAPLPKAKPPVKLKNGAFSSPVEGVVSGYALPGKGEIDPTFLVSLTYYCLYGLMLSDAAYGLIMVLGTLFVLNKFKGRLENGTRRMMQMFLGCGIATTFWGIMFGSFFGDAVNMIAKTFFNSPDVRFPVVWFEPVNEPIKMLGFSFIIGLIHIFLGLGALLYTNIKNGKVKDAIFDAVFWYMLVGSAVGLLLSTEMAQNMFNFKLDMPPALMTIFTALALIGAVGIILTGGRESKNPVKRILKGLYALYGISSYLSDVLSYSRLLALGLATGVISSVFNQIATMAGGGVVGAIFFIVIFVIGHTLNILINALGAYVHSNRLEYVEFFGKFYSGGGKVFTPFAENTKYYTVSQK